MSRVARVKENYGLVADGFSCKTKDLLIIRNRKKIPTTQIYTEPT